MILKVLDIIKNDLSPEVLFTAVCLYEKYGESLSVVNYAAVMGISKSTVYQQISDETVAVKPVKIGRKNFFLTIEVAKLLHQ